MTRDVHAGEPHRVISGYTELHTYTGLHRTQINELIAAGKFPKSVRLTARRKVWFARDVAAWQDQCAAEQAERERVERECAERDASRAERNRTNRDT